MSLQSCPSQYCHSFCWNHVNYRPAFLASQWLEELQNTFSWLSGFGRVGRMEVVRRSRNLRGPGGMSARGMLEHEMFQITGSD